MCSPLTSSLSAFFLQLSCWKPVSLSSLVSAWYSLLFSVALCLEAQHWAAGECPWGEKAEIKHPALLAKASESTKCEAGRGVAGLCSQHLGGGNRTSGIQNHSGLRDEFKDALDTHVLTTSLWSDLWMTA